MKVSIIVPFTFMPKWEFYLHRCLKSIEEQTFTDYEVILLKYGKAAETQNRLIKHAQGELVKILHMDDYFTSRHALQQIINYFGPTDQWLVTGCWHDDGVNVFYPHRAEYSSDIHTGHNTIGSPSVLTFRHDPAMLFDDDLDWLYDVSLYKKLYDAHGLPTIVDEYSVTIGLHHHQDTHRISEEQKLREIELMKKRYV